MDPNLTAHYMATEIERTWLGKQVERGLLAEQAAFAQHDRSTARIVRRWIGGLMITTGQRVQGLPEVAVLASEPQPAH